MGTNNCLLNECLKKGGKECPGEEEQSQWEQRKGWSIGPGDEVGLWLGHKTGCPEATSMAARYKDEKIQGGTEIAQGSCCNPLSSIQWASKCLIPSDSLSACWNVVWWGGQAGLVQSIKVFQILTKEQVWGHLCDFVNSLLLSHCSHLLITLNSPLECPASVWSQKLRENRDPLPQSLKHHLDYVVPSSGTFNGFLWPSRGGGACFTQWLGGVFDASLLE